MIRYDDIQLNFQLAPKTEFAVYLHPKVTPLEVEPLGPFTRNSNGELVGIHNEQAWISADDGKTWQAYPIFSSSDVSCSNSRSLVCLKSGVLLLSFANTAQYHFNWRRKVNLPTKNSYLHHWVVRSLDGGRSWQEPVPVLKGYAAAMTTAIQLSSGEVVMTTQNMDYDNGRHYALSLVSQDEGLSWQTSNHLDIGGRGHHGGCYEGTLTELKDGRLWYCIRTNQGWFWDAYSSDKGLSWTTLQPGLPASSSPGMLTRLQSGRLMLTYNPLTPILSDRELEARHFRGGLFSEVKASWFREELAVRFSDDEGRNWSDPVVVAQCEGAWLSYPYVCEVRPGEIWMTTMQSELKISFAESDLFR